MERYSLKILEGSRSGNTLTLGIRIKAPYDPSVREPKVAVIFDNGVEKRRLPLLVQTYFPEENLEKCTIFAKYAYKLNYLFFKQDFNESINFWFEFTYGDTVIDHIPFAVSRDVVWENVPEEEKPEYEVIYSEAMDSITYRYIGEVKEESEGVLKTAGRKVKNFIREVWKLLLFVMALLLLPVFCVDALLAFLGMAKNAPKNNKHGILKILTHIRWRVEQFSNEKLSLSKIKYDIFELSSKISMKLPIKHNRIAFISSRRTDLSGNFEFVYDILKKDKKLEFRFLLDDRNLKKMSLKNTIRYGYYFATSKVILIDDFTPLLYKIPRREGTTLIQLWHACGAFKTFGYSRMGKTGGQTQASPNHRNYDYAIVSSQEISKFYAEGFGISLEKAVATGVPRTDIFFDQAYKEKVQREFYEKYPQLKEKKILLFAPTFRGNGKLSGFYPVDKFEPVRVYEELNKEYAIIIKHHPFVRNRTEIPEEYRNDIIDLSENSELNDLLFVADLLVTDYSSVIFEAALLDVPMLFYAYDLQRYISTRGFYYEYEHFVPGKIVQSFARAMDAIKNQDFETEKIEAFKTRFFDDLDGKSSQRTADLIYKALHE